MQQKTIFTEIARVSDRQADGVRFQVCCVCKQIFDIQSLAEVYHHDNDPHLPMASGCEGGGS